MRPLRSEWPTRWAKKLKPRVRAKAAISGAITAFAPAPAAIITLVLSITQRGAVPSMKRAASSRKCLASKRV